MLFCFKVAQYEAVGFTSCFVLSYASHGSLGVCYHLHQRIYSCNEGNFDSWDEEIKRAVMGFKTDSPSWAQRYVGSMVSDVHRTLLYGGLFLYPADKKSTKGKNQTTLSSLYHIEKSLSAVGDRCVEV